EALATVLEACVNERCKQRMRSQRVRFELGVKLAADEPGVIRDFHDFDVDAVRSAAGDAESSARERVFIFAIKLVTVAVTLGDIGVAVSLVGERAGLDFAGPGPEAHRSAHFIDAEEFAQFVNYAIRRRGIEFGAIGTLQAGGDTRIFDRGALHSEAD